MYWYIEMKWNDRSARKEMGRCHGASRTTEKALADHERSVKHCCSPSFATSRSAASAHPLRSRPAAAVATGHRTHGAKGEKRPHRRRSDHGADADDNAGRRCYEQEMPRAREPRQHRVTMTASIGSRRPLYFSQVAPWLCDFLASRSTAQRFPCCCAPSSPNL